MKNCGYLSCWEWGCKCDLITIEDKIEHILFKATQDVKKGFTDIGDIKKYPNLIVFYRIELKEEFKKMSDDEINKMYESFN